MTEDIEFSHEATVLLIRGIRKRFCELSTNHRARPQIYRDLHDELTKHGYNYSVERIRRKWNNLLGTYKRIRKEHNPGKPIWEYLDVSFTVKLQSFLNLCMFKSREFGYSQNTVIVSIRQCNRTPHGVSKCISYHIM